MKYTTNQKGLITEMQVMLRFIEMGYNVSQPLNADSKYDCILDVNGQLLKIQIKTAHPHCKTKDAVAINCRSVTINSQKVKSTYYNNSDVDYFATFWDNELYLIPFLECSAEKVLHLSKGDKIYKNWSYLEDYKAEEVLNKI